MNSPEGGWRPLGPAYELRCPSCAVTVDEPPMETRTGVSDEGWTVQARRNTMLPALAVHVVEDHPESETARQLLAAVTAHRAAKDMRHG